MHFVPACIAFQRTCGFCPIFKDLGIGEKDQGRIQVRAILNFGVVLKSRIEFRSWIGFNKLPDRFIWSGVRGNGQQFLLMRYFVQDFKQLTVSGTNGNDVGVPPILTFP